MSIQTQLIKKKDDWSCLLGGYPKESSNWRKKEKERKKIRRGKKELAIKSIYIHTGNNSIEDDRVFEVNGKWDIQCIKLLDAYCMYWWPGGRLSIDCSSGRCTMAASWDTAYMLHTPMAPFRPFSHCKPVLYRWVRATRQPAFPNAAKHPSPSCFLWPHPRSKIILVLFISPA